MRSSRCDHVVLEQYIKCFVMFISAGKSLGQRRCTLQFLGQRQREEDREIVSETDADVGMAVYPSYNVSEYRNYLVCQTFTKMKSNFYL